MPASILPIKTDSYLCHYNLNHENSQIVRCDISENYHRMIIHI